MPEFILKILLVIGIVAVCTFLVILVADLLISALDNKNSKNKSSKNNSKTSAKSKSTVVDKGNIFYDESEDLSESEKFRTNNSDYLKDLDDDDPDNEDINENHYDEIQAEREKALALKDKGNDINWFNELAGSNSDDDDDDDDDSDYEKLQKENDNPDIDELPSFDNAPSFGDFTKEKSIGNDIGEVGPGYDHCYVTEMYNPENKHCGCPLDDSDLVEFAVVKEPVSGHEMAVYTNMEGCQFYTGNFIGGIVGKNGVRYQAHDAFCLETQCFPDTPNQTTFPSCILEPGQKMKAKTVYSFTTSK